MRRWRRKESNKNMVAEEEKQHKCGDAKKGGGKGKNCLGGGKS